MAAGAAALLVVVSVAITVLVQRRRPGQPLGPADSFFAASVGAGASVGADAAS